MRLLVTILFVLYTGNIVAQVNYAEFKGTKSSIAFVKKYRVANLYEYGANSKMEDSTVIKSYGYEIAEEALVRKYIQLLNTNTVDSISSKILLQSRLFLEIDNDQHTFIKYKLNAPGTNSQSLMIIDLIFKNNRWEENQNSNSETESIRSVFLMCKPETLFAFFNRRDDPKQPEINKLKLRVKNDTDVLDIKLLESIINQNKASMAKYLE